MFRLFASFALPIVIACSVLAFVLRGDPHDYGFITGIMSELDHVLIFFGCFLSIILFLVRNLGLISTLGALFAATTFVFAGGHFEMAYLILGEDKNPQIATVFLFLVSTACLLALALFKRTRTIDRTLVGTASLSMLMTGFLFHYVLIQTVLPDWAKDAAWSNSFLLGKPADEFLKDCSEAGLECWLGTEDVGLDASAVNNAFKLTVKGIDDFYEEAKPDHSVGHGFGAFNDLEPAGVAVVLYYRDGADVRVISDAKTGERIHGVVRDAFYLLSSFAHAVWLLGSLFLIWFHRRRFRARSCM